MSFALHRLRNEHREYQNDAEDPDKMIHYLGPGREWSIQMEGGGCRATRIAVWKGQICYEVEYSRRLSAFAPESDVRNSDIPSKHPRHWINLFRYPRRAKSLEWATNFRESCPECPKRHDRAQLGEPIVPRYRKSPSMGPKEIQIYGSRVDQKICDGRGWKRWDLNIDYIIQFSWGVSNKHWN